MIRFLSDLLNVALVTGATFAPVLLLGLVVASI